MINTTVLSSLAISALVDKQNNEQDNEQEEYYTIFEWNDGMKMERNISAHLFRCGGVNFVVVPLTICFDGIIAFTKYGEGEEEFRCLSARRVVWLAYKYLDSSCYKGYYFNHMFLPYDGYKLMKIAENHAPDRADPYEMAVYETGQKSKSLFVLDQEAFLKTIGGFKC